MSLKESSVPLIAITPEDNLNLEDTEDNAEIIKDAIDSHTDIEDLEMEFDDTSSSKNRRKLSFKHSAVDGGCVTDIEDVEASEDDDNDDVNPIDFSSPQFEAAVEGALDIEGTYEELFKYDSLANSGKTTVSTGQPIFHGLGFPEDSKVSGVVTDTEDVSASEDETMFKLSEKEVDTDILGEMIENMGTVDIADRIKKTDQILSPIHTPNRGATPSPGNESPDFEERKNAWFGRSSSPYYTSSHSLTPTPVSNRRRLSATTDTEMLESDSDEEKTVTPKSRHHSAKHGHSLRPPNVGKDTATDVEDVEFSDDEACHGKRSVPYDYEKVISSHAETSKQSVELSYKKQKGKKNPAKLNFLGLPAESEDTHTDVEDVEASGNEDDVDIEKARYFREKPVEEIFSIKEMESLYGSVMESETTIDTSGGQRISMENQLTDTEELAEFSPVKFYQEREDDDHSSVSSECSTEEGSVQDSDTDIINKRKSWRESKAQSHDTEVKFFDRQDGRDPIPVVVSPNASDEVKKALPLLVKSSLLYARPSDGGATDVEELSSDESDNDLGKVMKETGTKSTTNQNDEDAATDTEDFEADNLEDIDFSPNFPSLMNPEDIPGFPPPVRELTLIQQDKEGHPTVLVLPLDEVRARGLFNPEESGAAPTDIEDVTDSGDDIEDSDISLRVIDAEGNTTVLMTPDLPLIEGGIIESTDSMKIEKKKLKLPSPALADPTTDTEEMFLDTSPAQRRRKIRTRPQSSGSKKSSSVASSSTAAVTTVTDIEELEISDIDSIPPGMKLTKNRTSVDANESETTPSDGKTDLEDMEASDVEEDFNIFHDRATSATPDAMHGFGLETVSEKQGDGPFTEETRQHVLVQHMHMRSYDSKGLRKGTVPTIRMTSPSPDIPTTTDTEDIFASADEGKDSPTPPPTEFPLEMEEHSSVVHVKHTRKIDIDAPEEAIFVKGNRNIDVHTDVEDLGLSEEEFHHHGVAASNSHSKRSKDFGHFSESVLGNVSIYDDKNKVCVCMGDKDHKSIDNDIASRVCVCIGKPGGDIKVAPESSVSSEIVYGGETSAGQQQQENSEQATTMGQIEEWTERMQMKQSGGHESMPHEVTGSEFYQMQDPEATTEYVQGQPTTQSRVVTTRTLTRTVMGEDGRPVTVTTTETEVGDMGGAEGILDNNQLRESMQQIIDEFASGEESKEGRGKKEEKPQ